MNTPKSDEIEARLERSLRNQVRAPKLDGAFDSAVWARIEKVAAPRAVPTPRAMPRWLVASNAIGVLVAIALVIFVGGEAVSGVDIAVDAGIELPSVAPGLVERVITALMWPVTGVALLVGLNFTGIGRRLRAEFF
jgi:hypothetical protein